MLQLSFLHFVVVSEECHRVLRGTTVLHHVVKHILGSHAVSHRQPIVFVRLRLLFLTSHTALIPLGDLSLLTNSHILKIFCLTGTIDFVTILQVAFHGLAMHFLKFRVVHKCLTGVMQLWTKFLWFRLSVRLKCLCHKFETVPFAHEINPKSIPLTSDDGWIIFDVAT